MFVHTTCFYRSRTSNTNRRSWSVRNRAPTSGMSQPQGSSFRGIGSSDVLQPLGSSFVQQGSLIQPRVWSSDSSGPFGNAFQNPGFSERQQLGSSEVHQGDFIPMQTVASSGPTIVPEMPYQGYSSAMPSYNHPAGNNFNNNSFGTNHTFMQDA